MSHILMPEVFQRELGASLEPSSDLMKLENGSMQAKDDILDLLREKGSEAVRKLRRGVILQPGSIGDCILTLPLAQVMKDTLDLGGIDIMGHTEYTGILSGRSCIDGIRSMDLLDLHRLFLETSVFDVSDGDALVCSFRGYSWVVTFLGESGSDFEQNLIFTVNCSHSADVITLSLKPPKEYSKHLTEFYTQEFMEQTGSPAEQVRIKRDKIWLRPSETDINEGRNLLKDAGVKLSKKFVILHPGSGSLDKCWHLENFLAICKELISKGSEAIFLLGPAELERFSKTMLENIKGTGKCLTNLSLLEVLRVLSCAESFVGNDSGITHLAAGLGIRTLAVFGPTNPCVYGPLGPIVKVFVGNYEGFSTEPSADLQQEILKFLIVKN